MSNIHTLELPSVRDRVSEEEWQMRVDLAACYRLVAHYGWDDVLFTHNSARVPNSDHHFLINPLGLKFEEITASSLIKIDLDGNKILESPYGYIKAGFTIHSAIHMNREDAVCVMHTHTMEGMAVSAQKDGLLMLNQKSMCFHNRLAYHDFEGIATELDERERSLEAREASAAADAVAHMVSVRLGLVAISGRSYIAAAPGRIDISVHM